MSAAKCSNYTLGRSCDITPLDISNTDSIVQITPSSSYVHFVLGTARWAQIGTALNLEGSGQPPTIYVNADNMASPQSYLTRAGGQHRINSLNSEVDRPQTWYAAVYLESPQEFLVWQGEACPNNCSSMGFCDITNGQCSCMPNDDTIDCSRHYPSGATTSRSVKRHKPYPLFVALVGGGSGVVCAMIIALPIAMCCKKRNMRRRYERV